MVRVLGIAFLAFIFTFIVVFVLLDMKCREPDSPLLTPPSTPVIDRAHRIATLDGFAIYEVVRDGGLRELAVSPLCGKAQWGDALSECRP